MSNNPLKAIIKLSQTDFDNLKSEGSIIKNGQTIYYSPSDTIYMVEDEISEKIDEKLDKNQGISNAGKVLIVDEYGNVMPETLADGGTTVTVDGEVQSIWDADTKVDKTELPTKTSDLTNDSGFITLSAVPTATSELTNDGDGTQVSGAIDPYAKVSQIPTNNNQLTNGAGYATTSQLPTNNNQLTNGAGYVTQTEVDSAVETKTAVNVGGALQSSLNFDNDPQTQLNNTKDYVVEFGDNYRKWNSGKMEQWGNHSTGDPEADVSSISANITFPQPFIETPDGVLLSYNTTVSSAPNVTIEAYNIQNTSFSFKLGLDGQFLPMSTIFWTAKGKWK